MFLSYFPVNSLTHSPPGISVEWRALLLHFWVKHYLVALDRNSLINDLELNIMVNLNCKDLFLSDSSIFGMHFFLINIDNTLEGVRQLEPSALRLDSSAIHHDLLIPQPLDDVYEIHVFSKPFTAFIDQANVSGVAAVEALQAFAAPFETIEAFAAVFEANLQAGATHETIRDAKPYAAEA